MEYEEEENNVAGNVPEFGAIFMANAATKKESFKRKVFALPSSMENFVKQVKAGMILFLFEFEKRQLFGVYEATSDGAMNILAKSISFSGKQFPAQVCFTPIWICSPLSENEFQGAIKGNYYSEKEFNFGLSEDQVRQLLQLFSMRRLKDQLPRRQLSRTASRWNSKGRRRVDQGRFAMRDRLEMDHSDEDFTPTIMREYMENTVDRGIEADNDRIFIEDREDDEEKGNSVVLTDDDGGFLRKKRRVYYDSSEPGLFETCQPQLSFGTDNLETPMEKERISAASGRFLRGDVMDDDCNAFNTSAPANATQYSGGPSYLTKRADFERPYCDGANRLPTDDDRFLMNDIVKTKLNLHNSRRPVITNGHESGLLERAGKMTDDHEFLLNSRLGHKHYLDSGILPVVPSENFEKSLDRVRGTSGNGKLLMSKRVTSEHDLDNDLGLGRFSQKFGNSLDNKPRKTDERRFLPRENLVKANYLDGLHGSAVLNVSSGYNVRTERPIVDDCGLRNTSSVDNVHDTGTLLRPVISTERNSFSLPQESSVKCFNRSFPEIQFSDFRASQNFRTSNSTFNDAIVKKTVPCVPELPSFHCGRRLSIRDDQSAILARDTNHYQSGGDFLALSNIKSFEAGGSSRCNASDFGKNARFPTCGDCYSCHPDEIFDGMDLKSVASADYRSFRFSPSTLDSIPLTESHDFHSCNNSPLAFDGHPPAVSQGMEKYIHCQKNEEIFAGNEHFCSDLYWEDGDIYHKEKDLVNHRVESYKSYRANIANDHSQYHITREGAQGDSENPRKSVFTRLTSSQMLHSPEEEEEKIADFRTETSDDEVMEIMHQSRYYRMKNLKKFMPVVQQHHEGEIERKIKKISHIEDGHSKFMSVKINEDAHQAIGENIDEMPKETRVVEFKRRRKTKKSLDDNNAKSNILGKDEVISGQNAEPDVPLDKQQMRRKLVRPVFGSKNLDGINSNQN